MWSTWGIVIKIMVMPPWQVIFFSSLFSLPVLFLVARFYPSAAQHLMPDLRENFWQILLLAICLLLNLYFYFLALRHTSIPNAVFSHYTAPIFVALLAPLILHEKFDRWTGIALSVSLVGLFLMLSPHLQLSLNKQATGGIVFGVISGLAYAVTLIIAKGLTRELTPISIAFWQGTFIVVILAPIVVVQPLSAPPLDWMILVLLGFIHCSLAPLMYVSGLTTVMAQHVAIIGYLEPVSTVIMGMMFLRDIPSLTTAFGGVLIFAAGFLIIWQGRT
jgi:drug/metabolite transporter (DMT)-like permease